MPSIGGTLYRYLSSFLNLTLPATDVTGASRFSPVIAVHEICMHAISMPPPPPSGCSPVRFATMTTFNRHPGRGCSIGWFRMYVASTCRRRCRVKDRDVGAVTSMERMFQQAASFNGDISGLELKSLKVRCRAQPIPRVSPAAWVASRDTYGSIAQHDHGTLSGCRWGCRSQVIWSPGAAAQLC